jgi:hypothetical protein
MKIHAITAASTSSSSPHLRQAQGVVAGRRTAGRAVGSATAGPWAGESRAAVGGGPCGVGA